MKQGLFEIKENKALTASVYKMVLAGDTSAITAPGQFVNIQLEGHFLRRPISVCDCEDGLLTLLYKVVGKGYDLTVAGEHPLFIGGGVGVPPMYMPAKMLRAAGKKVSVILGFNTRDEVFYEDEFRALGCDVTVTTVDGSYGVKGFVTNAMENMDYSYFYTCGPEPMLKAVYGASTTGGQFSFEERMGCGFGACMGCSCKTVTGNKRICREGPVLVKEDILWQK